MIILYHSKFYLIFQNLTYLQEVFSLMSYLLIVDPIMYNNLHELPYVSKNNLSIKLRGWIKIYILLLQGKYMMYVLSRTIYTGLYNQLNLNWTKKFKFCVDFDVLICRTSCDPEGHLSCVWFTTASLLMMTIMPNTKII